MNGINMIITSYEQYIREAIKIIKNNSGPIRISSYGISFKSDSITREFLDLVIKEGNSTIIVGTSYNICTPDCPHCIKKNVLKTIQYFNYKFLYNVHFVKNVHLKLISRGDKGIVGGINLTGSGWTDAAVVVKNDNLLELNKHFDSIPKQQDNYFKPTRMVFPYGKYEGKFVKNVADPTYQDWCRKNFKPVIYNYIFDS